jgi:hypothetical protein
MLDAKMMGHLGHKVRSRVVPIPALSLTFESDNRRSFGPKVLLDISRQNAFRPFDGLTQPDKVNDSPSQCLLTLLVQVSCHVVEAVVRT